MRLSALANLIILIEVKSAEIALNDKHWKQLHNYFVALDVEFGILTNGLEYRFYTDMSKNHIMDKEPFLSLDMRKLNMATVQLLGGFTQARYDPERTVRNIKISKRLEAELNQPSDDFVRHFAKQVHAGSVFQKVIQEYRPIVKRAWNDLVDREIARRLARHEQETVPSQEKEPEPEPEIVEPPARLFELDAAKGIPIFANYKGNPLQATLLLNAETPKKSKIRFRGEVSSISPAALRAINTVNPRLKNAPNGWSFWKLRDPQDGEERKISDLRTDAALVLRLLEG